MREFPSHVIESLIKLSDDHLRVGMRGTDVFLSSFVGFHVTCLSVNFIEYDFDPDQK